MLAARKERIVHLLHREALRAILPYERPACRLCALPTPGRSFRLGAILPTLEVSHQLLCVRIFVVLRVLDHLGQLEARLADTPSQVLKKSSLTIATQ